MTLTLEKMKLEVSGQSASKSEDWDLWAGGRDHSVEGS